MIAESYQAARKAWEGMAGPRAGAVIADIQVGSEFRWTAEEHRVSLFAQPLGTSVKASPQRCEKLLTGK